jgi:hypothetical protein
MTTYIASQAIFTQNGDACESNRDQALEIESLDGGAGTYYVIKTDRWAFDSIEELTEAIQKFINAHTAAKNKIEK